MLARIGGAVVSVVKWALLALGALVVVLVWWLSSGDGKPKDTGAGKVQAVPAVQAEPVQEGCACSSGAVCTGPRGGQYCLDEGGKRRYR